MRDYLLSAGFQEVQINKRKYASYLCYKFSDSHYIIHLYKNEVKHFMKKFYNVKMDIFPTEMIIVKYNNDFKIKIMDKVKRIKEIPVMKKQYELLLNIGIGDVRIDYAVVFPEKCKIDDSLLQILQLYDIQIFYEDDKYFSNIDEWLDKN